jgi:hypothetical protein
LSPRALGRQDDENKTKTQHNICWTPPWAKNTNNVNKTWALLQTTGGKTNRASFLCGNRNGHHNTEHRTLHSITKILWNLFRKFQNHYICRNTLYNETNVLTFLINCSMIPRNGTGFGPGIPNRLHKLCCHSE